MTVTETERRVHIFEGYDEQRVAWEDGLMTEQFFFSVFFSTVVDKLLTRNRIAVEYILVRKQAVVVTVS